MPPPAQVSRWFVLGAVAVVVAAGHWLTLDLHVHRCAELEQQRAVRLEVIASLRSAARQARQQVRECRARRVAAKEWHSRLAADRRALGRHLVATLDSSAVRIVDLQAVSGTAAGEEPAVLVRWRGSYTATLDVLAALGAGGVPLRFESLRLRRLEPEAEVIEAEGTVVGGWLPRSPGNA